MEKTELQFGKIQYMKNDIVGKYANPAGQNGYWKIRKVRQSNNMILVEFENNFVCNIEVVKFKGE